MPTDTYEDGSPCYDHGHDPETGATWHLRGDAAARTARHCSACHHDHPAMTTCCDCERCLGDELSDAEEARYQGLVGSRSIFGGFEAEKGLTSHNQNLRVYASCDGTCGMKGCRSPYFDHAGLTRYRDDELPIGDLPKCKPDLPAPGGGTGPRL